MNKNFTIQENSDLKKNINQQKQFGFSWRIFSIFCIVCYLFSFQITDTSPISIFAFNKHWSCSQDCLFKNEKAVFVSESSKELVTVYIFNEELNKRKEFNYINYKYSIKSKLKRSYKNDWTKHFFKRYTNRYKLYAYNPRLSGSSSLLYGSHLSDTTPFDGFKAGFLSINSKLTLNYTLFYIKEFSYSINHKLRGPPEYIFYKSLNYLSIITNLKKILS